MRIYPGVTRILVNLQSIKSAIATENKILNYLNVDKADDDFSNLMSKKNIQFEKRIRLENLSYEINGRIILKNLNLSFCKNEFIGIYGTSGSGKTTLLNLLMGFIEPTKGRILVDDVELNNSNFYKWIENLGYVSQNSFLLNDTIENNITLSSNKPDKNKIEESINKAQLSNFFKGKVNLKSFLDEYASNVSGGEKQRLSIARAIYKNADTLFFDEPTSSLDEKTSNSFLDVVSTFYKKKTMFMVSHKIQNLGPWAGAFRSYQWGPG